jgi:hypothetical protein
MTANFEIRLDFHLTDQMARICQQLDSAELHSVPTKKGNANNIKKRTNARFLCFKMKL